MEVVIGVGKSKPLALERYAERDKTSWSRSSVTPQKPRRAPSLSLTRQYTVHATAKKENNKKYNYRARRCGGNASRIGRRTDFGTGFLNS